MNAIMLIIKNWKYLAIAVVCISISSYITYKFQDIRYKDLQGMFNGCQTSLNSCMVSNEENVATIDRLKKEILSVNKSCENRINNYKKLLSKLQNIDNLSGGRDEKDTTECSDDICVNLNSLWK